METTSFKELIDTERDFNALLLGLNIHEKNSYIHQEYKLISKLNELVGDIKAIHDFRIKNGLNDEIELAISDLVSLRNLLKYFNECKRSILKSKIKHILKLSSLTKENEINNIARNTLFEFLLYGNFRSIGMQAEIKSPNPDILVKVNDKKYFIQCKRIFSQKESAIRSNIEAGLKQLHSDLKGEDENSLGVISLSLERFLKKDGNKFINDIPYENVESAIQLLKEKLRSVIEIYGGCWRDETLNKDKRIVGIFLYFMEPTRIYSDNPVLSTVSHLTLSNIGSSESEDFKQLVEDIKGLKLIEESQRIIKK